MKRPNVDPAALPRAIPESVAGDLAIHPDYASPEALLAIGGRAFFGDDDDDPDSAGPYQRCGDVAVISIDGLLLMRGGWLFDGHESIATKCMAAINDPRVASLAFKINSPGGLVAGCFEAVDSVRMAAKAAGKPIRSHAKAAAFSAAYAWASAGDEVYLSPSAGVGSVGVIRTMTSEAGALEQMGLKVAVIRSGARKADGNSALPLDPEAVAEAQKQVDYQASLFALVVGDARGMSESAVLDLQAACFYGPDAVKAGLADAVMTEDDFMALCMSKGRGKEQTMDIKAKALGAEATGQDFTAALAASVTEAANARVERDTFKATAEKAEAKAERYRSERDELAKKFAAYVGQEAKLAGKGTVESVDRMLASMVDDHGVPRATQIAEHFAAIERGAALPKETKEPAEGPSAKGPSAKDAEVKTAALDGSKMTLTAIAAHASNGELFSRLLAEHHATQTRSEAVAQFPTLGRN